EELLIVFQPPIIEKFELDTEPENALLTVLSGAVAVADWLGSDEKIFGYVSDYYATADYAARAQAKAQEALKKHQWRGLPDLLPARAFGDLFPGKVPHAAQTQALQAAQPLTPPALVILEAPMGSGKTEAALGMYAHWAHTADMRGLYVAMPTMATSNQMHTRVNDFLQRVYGADIEPMLIHSRAELKDALADDSDRLAEEDRAGALAWFLPRKKSLLFPFGVGTVDQALMSVLQTKHFFVRLLGLSHKVIIFDEVHAYDAYMNTLFKRLLEWLRQVGASVIILSATLPDKTRRELAEAFGAPADSLPPQTYPRLTWTAQGRAAAVALPAPAEPRRLQLEWMTSRDDNAIIALLRAELANGGCAAVICNTVKRAQALYQALVDDNRREPWVNVDDLMLFHARYPFAWRDKREKNVLAKFGRPDEQGNNKPKRPERAVVIATQVIEQSLDLDFDLMISDFAPTDLLLQRAGRLHRHIRNERPPLPDRLLIAAPTAEDGVPQFERYEIYERYVLLRSWLTVRRYGETMTLPNDLTEAIEQTYDDAREFAEATVAMREALEKAREKMERDEAKSENEAHLRLVREPSFPRLLREPNTQLEEDNPDLHTAFQALTRLAEPGITLVCVHEEFGSLYLEPGDRSTRIDPYHPDDETAKKLTLYTVTVQDHRVVQYFSAAEQLSKTFPSTWQKIAALRYHRLAIFDNEGHCAMEGTPYTLRLTRELGVEIRKQEAA
ncbi:MAG: CRISPR-associated helicase Cas3', partial [Anaerolineales bacterium]